MGPSKHRCCVLVVGYTTDALAREEALLRGAARFEVERYTLTRRDDAHEAIIERVAAARPEVVLLGLDGARAASERLIGALREITSAPELVVILSESDVRLAVGAMKQGAHECFVAPVDEELLLATLGRLALRTPHLSSAGSKAFTQIVTQSSKMCRLLDYVEGVAPSDNPVLIWGDSGTGKELIARAIHRLSRRSGAPFVAVNAGVFAHELFASEFFGHIKGAFSGATADKPGLLEEVNGGTLFLDEVGELELSIQVKLLRVLQEGEFFRVGSSRRRRVDVRLITATNKNLQGQIERGYFRTDLFYRLNVCSVFVPPLKEREGDIPLLAQFFVEKYARVHDKTINGISDEVLALLDRYDYPGNVRELENIINSSILIERERVLSRASLPQYFLEATQKARYTISNAHHKSIAEVEREHIERVLQHTGGNRTLSAKILRISRVSLINRIQKYQIDL